MARAPNFERLRTALFCGEPDWVPLVELGVAPVIKEGFLGREIQNLKDEVDFWCKAGYDYVKLSPIIDFNPQKIAPSEGEKKTEMAGGHGQRNWASEHCGVITSIRDFENYVWPKIEEIDYSNFEQITDFLPDSMAVIGQYGDVYTWVWNLMGFETFSMALFEDIELIEAMFDRIGTIEYSMFKSMTDFDCVQALWYTDDLAYKHGLMVSPEIYRKYLFPWMKKIGDLTKERNIPYMYHSDGVLWQVMDDLLDCGINALHPIEPTAMDIEEVKERYKGRLCVIGNIDLTYTLTQGTPQEVEEQVKQKIKKLAPGGGYCLGSSNSVPEYVKMENYIAMIEATEKYGKYPISI